MIDYFKELADETGMPYQNLINLYLRDCVSNNRKPVLEWEELVISLDISPSFILPISVFILTPEKGDYKYYASVTMDF